MKSAFRCEGFSSSRELQMLIRLSMFILWLYSREGSFEAASESNDRLSEDRQLLYFEFESFSIQIISLRD